MCEMYMCYDIIKKCGPTRAENVEHARVGAGHTRTGSVTHNWLDPHHSYTVREDEPEEKEDSPVYTHINSPTCKKTPFQIYINTKGNLISHI